MAYMSYLSSFSKGRLWLAMQNYAIEIMKPDD